MKVIYKHTDGATLNSGGIRFMNGREYEVTEKVAKYLKDTFGDKFELVVEKKVEGVKEVIAKPAAKKPTPRTRATTKKPAKD